ncbi:hypothetical protein O3P69_016275 [Scylla paramamosain]|uniref:Transposase n=1 Tax=Scylla paramamosain TaxID=85552 RepID=A0AAW0SBZ9_SCYPA
MQLARKSVTSDPFVIYGFYDMLEKEMDRLNIKDRPECIYNLDETGFPMDPSKSKTIGSKGEKTVRLTHGANRENITVLATCCADDSKAGCSHRTNDQSNSLTSPINQDAENNTLSKFSTAELVDELQRRAPSGMKYVITLELKPNETTLEEVLHARGRSATPVVKRRRVIPMKGQVITNEECLKEIKGKEEKKMQTAKQKKKTKQHPKKKKVEVSDTDSTTVSTEEIDYGNTSSDISLSDLLAPVTPEATDEVNEQQENADTNHDMMPKLSDDSVNKYYAVFYTDPKLKYYWEVGESGHEVWVGGWGGGGRVGVNGVFVGVQMMGVAKQVSQTPVFGDFTNGC